MTLCETLQVIQAPPPTITPPPTTIPPTTIPPGTTIPPEGEVPWVAIGVGIIGIGALAYILTKK